MERRRISGFTLIELMIVVAIVVILTMVALPSYRDYVVRSNRAAVQQFMLEVASRQERYLLDNRAYTNNLANLGWASEPAEVDDNYNVTATVASTPPSYTITATAIGAQDSDDTDCGNLTLTSAGVKGSEHGGTRCWR